MASRQALLLSIALLLTSTASLLPVQGQLRDDFYDHVCPQALPAMRAVVSRAIELEPRMGASLVRLHFHDCFVNVRPPGCDGSILLDDDNAVNFVREKTANPNSGSIRGFEVIDEIKAAVNGACFGNVVSCADIVAVAARESVSMLGGPWYQVLLGRRDSRTASREAANDQRNLAPPTSSLQELLASFASKGLTMRDLVALSGAHTIGSSQCRQFRDRAHDNNANIDRQFQAVIRQTCPLPAGEGDSNLTPLDGTPTRFDTTYFRHLLERRGLLHSDQQLFTGDGDSSEMVRQYSQNAEAFWEDFKASMVRMGNLGILTGENGEIRMNCRRRN